MKSPVRLQLTLCLFLISSRLLAESPPSSELQSLAEKIGPVEARRAVAGISARAEASGTRRVATLADGSLEPIAYGFTRVELHAGKNGRWQAIGNASSARP